MVLKALTTPRYIRKTELNANEYHRNFRQIDDDIIEALSSPAADKVTPLLSKIYLRLRLVPSQYWERPGVIFIRGEEREGKWVNAWIILCEIVGVASATANKAFDWLHEEGIIGYNAHKNNAGIRIFLNRATNSIGRREFQSGSAVALGGTTRTGTPAPEKWAKVSVFPATSAAKTPASAAKTPASPAKTPASPGEAAFKDVSIENNFKISDIPRAKIATKVALDNAADAELSTNSEKSERPATTQSFAHSESISDASPAMGEIAIQELASRLHRELIAALRVELATQLRQQIPQMVSQAQREEAEQTRKWFNDKALPKAIRVAQHEAYQILRQSGQAVEEAARHQAASSVGRQNSTADPANPPVTTAQSTAQITELAEICLTQLELCGQPISATVAAMVGDGSAQSCLHPTDAPRVQAAAEALCRRQLLPSGETGGEIPVANCFRPETNNKFGSVET